MKKKTKGIIITSILLLILISPISYIIYIKTTRITFSAKVKESSKSFSIVEVLSNVNNYADYPILLIDTTTTISTTTKITTRVKSKNNISKDNIVVNDIKNKLNLLEANQNDKSFDQTAKKYFISAVDFIFYDKDINRVYFKDLTNGAKLKVISLALKLDGLIDKYYPNYKEGLSSNYQNVKTKLIELYLNKTTEYCINNDEVCNEAKSNFQDLKNSLNLTWDVIKSIGNTSISKLRKWYEIYSGK